MKETVFGNYFPFDQSISVSVNSIAKKCHHVQIGLTTMKKTAHKYENCFNIAVTKILIQINSHISYKKMSCSKGNETNTKDTINEPTHECCTHFTHIIRPTECITEIIESRVVSELADSLVNCASGNQCPNVERISLPKSTAF